MSTGRGIEMPSFPEILLLSKPAPPLPRLARPAPWATRNLLAALLYATLGHSPEAAARDEKVVAPGDTLAGSLIQSADAGRINANGQVAFQAQTPSERVVLIGSPDGGYFEVARTGAALPAGGSLGALSSELDVADDGHVALRGGIDVGSPLLVNAALRANVDDGLVELYRAGDPAPGGTAYGASDIQMMSAGTVIFRSSFGTGGVSDGFGLFRTMIDLSPLEALVLDDQVHAHSGHFVNVGGIIGRVGGNAVTFGALASFDGTTLGRPSIWRTNSPIAPPTLFAREGGAVAGGRIESIALGSAATMRIDGTTVFAGVLSFLGVGERDALMVASGAAAPSLFNKEGDVEPTYGETYASFTPIPQADAGLYVGFRADFQSGRECLFRDGAEIPGRALCLARTGDDAPGEVGDVNYVALGSAGAGGLQLLAFDADVQQVDRHDPGPVLRGLYLLDPQEEYRITREGLAIGRKTVADVSFLEVNRNGQVLYGVDYADGSNEQRLYTPTLHWRAAVDGAWNQSGNWTLHVAPARVHDVRIDPDVDVTVQGPTALAGARTRTLEVGGGAGEATLNHFSGQLLRVGVAPLLVHPNGRITAGHAPLHGGLVNHGVVELATPPNSHLHMVEGEIENHGVVQGSGFVEASDFVNQPGGLVRIGAGETLTADVAAFVNLGTVDVAAGGTATFEGVVSGDGLFTGAGTKNFLGGIAPGSSPGTLAIGGPALIGQSAVVVLEIAGNAPGAYDHIDFDDVAIAGGVLEVRFTNGFIPSVGDAFPLLDWTTRVGSFERVALPPGIEWDVDELYTQGVIAVPEPEGAALAGVIALASMRLGRRRSRCAHRIS